MNYKKGDKVVVEIVSTDTSRRPYEIGNSFNTVWLEGNQILGKVENFQPAQEKIKMTVEEKKEFDELKRTYEELFLAFSDIYDEEYPNLFDYLFDDDDDEKNNKTQLEFARAWDKPSRIEVEKPKRYYVHLISDKPRTYLGCERTFKNYFIGGKGQSLYYQTQFTKDEIAKIPQDTFRITDKALEEVEEDENDI